MKEIKKGKLLISTPNVLGDLYFNRSIIILTEVKEEEVVGFILNKSLDYSLSDLYKNVKNNKIKVHSGGPVNQDNLYFIHNKPNVISDSIKFFNGLYWGGNFESVIESINSEKLDDSSIKFFSGYTGWSYHQLIDEIKNDSWIIANNDDKIEFNKDSKKLWGDYMKKMSTEFKIWSNAPENPQSNQVEPNTFFKSAI